MRKKIEEALMILLIAAMAVTTWYVAMLANESSLKKIESDTLNVDGTKFQTFKYRGTRYFKEIK
jgi:hypothetical protein